MKLFRFKTDDETKEKALSLRLKLILVLNILVLPIFMGKAVNILFSKNLKLDKKADSLYTTQIKMKSRRGSIFDENGKELAISLPAYSLFVDPKFIIDKSKTSLKLAQLLNLNKKNLFKKVSKKNKRFVWVKRQISPQLKKKIIGWGLPGIHFIKEPKRFYPSQKLASPLLGFVGRDGEGLEGLEYQYNNYLAGKDKELWVSRDARGRPLIMDMDPMTEPPEGLDLYLSLDSEVQFVLEDILNQGRLEFEAKQAMGVVVDVKTGAIKAMAQAPGFNANTPFEISGSKRKTIAITDAYEQGSTIKVLTVAGALERSYKPLSEWPCEKKGIYIGKRVIRDSKKLECESMTLMKALKISSNTVHSRVALTLGEQWLKKLYQKFGIGLTPSVDYPGASAGLFKKKTWTDGDLASSSFGHGFSASALQTTMAYQAIANEGVLLEPYFLKQVKNIKDEVVYQSQPQKVHRVISKKSASLLLEMMVNVTEEGGTGVKAQVLGFPVAGKTGTANKVNLIEGGYYKDKYLSSFVGIVPANSPQYVIYIAYDEPKTKTLASQVAAPSFSKVAQYLMRKSYHNPLYVQARTPACENCKPIKSSFDAAKELKRMHGGQMPKLKGLSLRQAISFLKPTGKPIEFFGEGAVLKTVPQFGHKYTQSDKIVIHLKPKKT